MDFQDWYYNQYIQEYYNNNNEAQANTVDSCNHERDGVSTYHSTNGCQPPPPLVDLNPFCSKEEYSQEQIDYHNNYIISSSNIPCFNEIVNYEHPNIHQPYYNPGFDHELFFPPIDPGGFFYEPPVLNPYHTFDPSFVPQSKPREWKKREKLKKRPFHLLSDSREIIQNKGLKSSNQINFEAVKDTDAELDKKTDIKTISSYSKTELIASSVSFRRDKVLSPISESSLANMNSPKKVNIALPQPATVPEVFSGSLNEKNLSESVDSLDILVKEEGKSLNQIKNIVASVPQDVILFEDSFLFDKSALTTDLDDTPKKNEFDTNQESLMIQELSVLDGACKEIPGESKKSRAASLENTPEELIEKPSNDVEKKIFIRLPPLKSLNITCPVKGSTDSTNHCDETKDCIEKNEKTSNSSNKKSKPSKEDLRLLKLARRETDCQVVYGTEEKIEYCLKKLKNNQFKASESPYVFKNYITRHLINRISSTGKDYKHSTSNLSSLYRDKSQTKTERIHKENKYPQTKKTRSVKSPKKYKDKLDTLSVGMQVLALDRWSIWCEAHIIQIEPDKVLIKYDDELVRRKEWITLASDRIRNIRQDEPTSSFSDVEILNPSLSESCDIPQERSKESSPLRPNNYYFDFGHCSNCSSLFEKFRYFCLHCPGLSFTLCEECYLYNFPRKHAHSRLVFSKQSLISFSNTHQCQNGSAAKAHNILSSIFNLTEDNVYNHEDRSTPKEKLWSASLESIKLQQPSILGVHRFLSNSRSVFKPNIIMCVFCHGTQHTSCIQKDKMNLIGDFISLDNPFMLPVLPRNYKSNKLSRRRALMGSEQLNNPSNYTDLFWCHFNCARFSSGVFIIPKVSFCIPTSLETVSLLKRFHFYNIAQSVRSGNRQQCPRCREKGATIACNKPGCDKNYHLQCTGKNLDFFERGHVFYCRSHETVLQKGLPLINVIGSMSCNGCGGLLPRGRIEENTVNKDMESPDKIILISNTAEETAISEVDPTNKAKELINVETFNDDYEGAELPVLIDESRCAHNTETPDSSWSWYTCQECLTSENYKPFDLCYMCFEATNKGIDHPHEKHQFRWTNYHDVANTPERERHLFKRDEPIEYSSNKPPLANKRKLILAMNSCKKKREKRLDSSIQSTPIKQCAYCWDTELLIWRKGYSGVLLCGKCFERSTQEIENSIKPSEPQEKITIKLKINFDKAVHDTEKALDLFDLKEKDIDVCNYSSDHDKPTNLIHQYTGEVEDYHHFPYYTRVICNDENFNDSFTQAKFLNSYAPTESQWFSLLITSSYYDIPGRAPRWGSHSGSDYHGTWLPQTVRRALLRYTRPNEKILSNFLGRGTDAIECFLLKRKCTGIDINPVAISISQKNCSFALPIGIGITAVHRPVILQGDSRDLKGLDNFVDGSFDHVLSHPPYKDCVSYSTNIDGDLSKFANQQEFLSEMTKVIKENWRLLKMNGRLTLGIGDNREKCFYVPVSFQLLRTYLNNGFELEEIIVKRQRHCQMFGLGTYLSAHYGFLILTHEYIFTLQKVPKEKKPSSGIKRFLRAPEEVKRWKYLIRIRRRCRAIPSCPVERKSVIMGTVWNFRPQGTYTFELLCKSRMVERFGKNGANWEDVDLTFPKFKDELSDMKPAEASHVHVPEEVVLSEYEKQRESKIRENSQKLLSLGLTVELGDERSEDVTHYNKMSKLASNTQADLFLFVIPHVPNFVLVNEALPIYRKAIVSLAQAACKTLVVGGFFIVGVQDYRIQELQGGGQIVPLSLLVYEDIEREINLTSPPRLKLKEMVICVPDGFQCNRSKEVLSLPVEPSILDLKPEDPFPNLTLVHATYLVYMRI